MDPQETAELVKKHYGLAGKRYIEILKKLGVDEIRRIQKEFQAKLHDDEAMQKQSMSLAILLTADKIATDYLFSRRKIDEDLGGCNGQERI